MKRLDNHTFVKLLHLLFWVVAATVLVGGLVLFG